MVEKNNRVYCNTCKNFDNDIRQCHHEHVREYGFSRGLSVPELVFNMTYNCIYYKVKLSIRLKKIRDNICRLFP